MLLDVVADTTRHRKAAATKLLFPGWLARARQQQAASRYDSAAMDAGPLLRFGATVERGADPIPPAQASGAS
jgi:hypothetical protein